MDDGLEDVKLEMDYGPHRAGETIRVDPGRASWIRSAQAKELKAAPAVAPRAPAPVAVKTPALAVTKQEEAPHG